MRPPPNVSFSPALLASVVAALLAGAIYALNDENIATLRFVAGTPRASLEEPRVGEPAIYAGTVHGPPGRTTPAGQQAAAYWFTVDRKSGKSRETVCSYHQHDRLVLREGERTVPLALFTTKASVQVISDDYWSPGEHPTTIDLGSTPQVELEGSVPAGVTGCHAASPRYREQHLPEGASVEVLACFRDGALHPCDAVERGTLAVNGMGTYQRHGIGATLGNTLLAIVPALVLMLVAVALAYNAAMRVFQGRLPAERRP